METETGMEKIPFYRDYTSREDFYILGETTQGGARYILVTDAIKDGGNCKILKEENQTEKDDIIYSEVSDNTEAAALAKIFEELLEDLEIEL